LLGSRYLGLREGKEDGRTFHFEWRGTLDSKIGANRQ